MDQEIDMQSAKPPATNPSAGVIAPAADTKGEAPCPSCAAAAASSTPPSFVYAIGRIEPRFPRLSVEKEYAQAVGRLDTKGRTDAEALAQTLAQPENRYLARQMCWVLTVHGLETYILYPRDIGDFERLIESMRERPSPMDTDVVIGVRGPVASPDTCNGLMVPIVAFDQIYSFNRDALMKAIPRSETIAEDQFRAASTHVFDRIWQMTDNAGALDEHRALNYLAMRYPGVYAKAAEEYAAGSSLSEISVLPSRPGATRKLVDVVFAYTNRTTDYTDKCFVRVDVTEEFPFLVSKISPYYDH